MKFILLAAALVALSSGGVPIRRSDRARAIRASRGIDFENQVAANVIRHAPRNARLIDFRTTGPISDEALQGSLIDNATLIRDKIIGGFDCNERMYGYYADQQNGCQIFHVCVPLAQIYEDYHFTKNDIMHFAFICPKYTIFTQDAMVCAWERSAVPCENAHELYYLNQNFFIIPEDVPKEKEVMKQIRFDQ